MPFSQYMGRCALKCSKTLVRLKSTFVSKHHAISPADLGKVVGVNGYFNDYRLKDNGELFVKTCFGPCERGNKGKADNAWKLTIRKDGSFYCFRCGDKGNWYQLKQRLTGRRGIEIQEYGGSNTNSEQVHIDRRSAPYPPSSAALEVNNSHITVDESIRDLHRNLERSNMQNQSKEIALPNQRDSLWYHLNLTAAMNSSAGRTCKEQAVAAREELNKLEKGQGQVQITSAISRALVRHYLQEERGLSDDVVVRYGVGCTVHPFPIYGDADPGGADKKHPVWREKVCVTFPWFSQKTKEVEAILASQEEKDKSSVLGVYKTKRGNIPEGLKDREEIDSVGDLFIKRVKLRAIDAKGLQRTLPKGGGWGFFGWQTVQEHHKSVIITEGEYDAMAAAQGMMHAKPDHPLSGVPAISLPNGCNSLPPELLPCLEQFDRIYLWLDNDKPGQDASDKFARKLGIHRCMIVRPPDCMKDAPKDANDALRMMNRAREAETIAKRSEATSKKTGKAVQVEQNTQLVEFKKSHLTLIPDMLDAAKPISHQRLETFSSLRGEVLRNIRQPQQQASGTAISSMPGLSKMIMGLRKGELALLTGPTGCGKTTLLSQISLDLAKQGASTLWGSFEIRNPMLLEKMMSQFGGLNLKTLSEEGLESLADDFESLPLKFMNFHAGTDLSQVLEAMDFAVYRDDVQHIIIDNLQFMMPRASIPGITSPSGTSTYSSRQMTNFDKFAQQDAVIDEFRRFATEKQVNIILVIHPRKEDENQMLGMSSIFGSAKATQEADLVLILQRIAASRRYGNGAPPGGEDVPESMALSVKKNRYNGNTGKIDIGFNSATKTFFEKARADPKKGPDR